MESEKEICRGGFGGEGLDKRIVLGGIREFGGDVNWKGYVGGGDLCSDSRFGG